MPVAMSRRSDSASSAGRGLPSEVQELSFFHPDIRNSDQASDRLKIDGQGPGSFLLRPSSKGNAFLSISVCIPNRQVRHVNIAITNKAGNWCYYIVPEVQFPTIKALREHYKEHRICNMEMIDHIRLEHPVHYLRHSTSFSSNGSDGNTFSTQSPRNNFAQHMGPRNSRRQDSGGSQGSIRDLEGSPSGLGWHASSGSFTNSRGSTDTGSPGFLQVRRSSSDRKNSGNNFDEVFHRDADLGMHPQGPSFGQSPPGDNWMSSNGGGAQAPAPAAAAGTFGFDNMPPPLPTFTKKEEKGKADKKDKKDKKKEKAGDRPPMPLPNPVGKPGENPYYTHPRDVTETRLPELKKALIESDRCECGLRLVDAELPLGWTLHRVREPAMMNKPFFQDMNGITRWSLPEEIVPHLTAKQRDFVIQQFEQNSMRVPAPLLQHQPSSPGSSADAIMY